MSEKNKTAQKVKSDGKSTGPSSEARSRRDGTKRMSPALDRLNNLVFKTLGPEQRDWLLNSHSLERDGGDTADLAARAKARIDRRERQRQANIEVILAQAFAHLPPRVHDGPLDPDWSMVFFDLAADCSDPDKQKIWSRLLSQAIAEPKLAAVSACRLLSGLPADVLRPFEIMAGLTINNFVVRLGDEFFDDLGLSDDGRLLLEEYGLLRTNKDLNRVFKSQNENEFVTHLLYLDKALKITHEDPEKTLTLASYRLTSGGASLARAIAEEKNMGANTEYLVEVVRLLQRKDFKIAQADILEYSQHQLVSRHSRFCEIMVLDS